LGKGNRLRCIYAGEEGKPMKCWRLQTGSWEESKVNKRASGWEDEDMAARGIS